jgi:hypothetical protein
MRRAISATKRFANSVLGARGHSVSLISSTSNNALSSDPKVADPILPTIKGIFFR